MTKSELLSRLGRLEGDDNVVSCVDTYGVHREYNIEEVKSVGSTIEIRFGGGPPFSSDN
jgi:hypothetical protein